MVVCVPTHLLCWNGVACQAQIAGVCIGGKDGHRGCHSSFCSLPCGAGERGQINTCVHDSLSNNQASKQASSKQASKQAGRQQAINRSVIQTSNQATFQDLGSHQANQVTRTRKPCLHETTCQNTHVVCKRTASRYVACLQIHGSVMICWRLGYLEVNTLLVLDCCLPESGALAGKQAT